MKNLIILFVLTSFILGSCKKAENRSCFKSIGKNTEKTIELPSFDKLFLKEHIEYLLVQDSTDKLVIKGGENLVNFINWSIDDDGVLYIENKNKCNFLRKLDQIITCEIHFTSLSNVQFEGTEPMKNIDTLNVPYFVMMIRDGAGSVNLTLKSLIINTDISHGWGDYTLSGTTDYARISARSNGYCDVQNLKIKDSVFVSSETVGKIILNANGIPLNGEIKSFGDIWYYGNPTSISVKEISTGKLIKK
jgi:hypothetical protein